ncbi:MAG TPA: DUF4190 domain-containing protein [Candidatus Dormibacteraeota bacterium]|nr:DUF4190 domain-containing protein [Candidatus Dormibacteraeota bacterium]
MPPPPPPGGGGGFAPPPPPPGGGYTPGGGMQYASTRTDGLAIASLVTGILSLVCCVVFLGVILGPAAAIMGFLSRGRVAQSNGTLGGGGLAIGGLILGVLGFIASIGWFFFFVIIGRNATTT